LAVNHATAHPHVNEDGTIYNMGNSIGSKGPAYNVIEFPSGTSTKTTFQKHNFSQFFFFFFYQGDGAFSEPKIVATFPSRWKMSHSYYHSFGITENYFVFVEYPLIANAAVNFIRFCYHTISIFFCWNSGTKM
jgi:carotenoid cleavage dioxygenase-like enzyme